MGCIKADIWEPSVPLHREVGEWGALRPAECPIKTVCELVAKIRVTARWMLLDTNGYHPTIPMLRGVWGAALHDLDHAAYAAVFRGRGPVHARNPGYILRWARAAADRPCLEHLGLGWAASLHDQSLMRAWDMAGGMGLGPRRVRFRLDDVRPLGPAGPRPLSTLDPHPWPLDRCAWPLPGDPAATPCTLSFPSPLRLMRDGCLIETPTLPDIVLAAWRRLLALQPPWDETPGVDEVGKILLALSRDIPARTWKGAPADVRRYSARQERRIDLEAVTGALFLPQGPGLAWPLLAAAQWLHIGKGTVMGMGRLAVLADRTELPESRF